MLANSLTLTRYRIIEDVPMDLATTIPDKLKQFAFIEIDATADERSFGWVNFDNMLDMGWTQSPPEKANYIMFALRVDTRKIPPTTLKKHYEEALEKELARNMEQGKNFVSRDRKRELKEQVTLRLRSKTVPTPAVNSIVWDFQANRIYIDTGTSKTCALFEDYFSLTFDLHIEPLTPFFLAMELKGEPQAHKLENLEPTIFV